jgi:U4/U6.U5 tri-snRNP-associated protein 1
VILAVAQKRKAEQATQEAADATRASVSKPGVLEFDDTSEFVRSITYSPPVPTSMKQGPIIVKIDTHAARAEEDSDEEMEADEAITEMDAKTHVKEEEDQEMGEDETAAMLNAIEDAIKKSEADSQDKIHATEAEGAAVRIQCCALLSISLNPHTSRLL